MSLLKSEKDNVFGKNWSDWLNAILCVSALLFIFYYFQKLGWLNNLNFGAQEITWGIAFLVGLVASVSSCLAVVGGVVIAFSEKYATDGKSFFQSSIQPNLFFHIGRWATFFVLGGLLGFLGGQVNISGNFVFYYTFVVALVMGWLGLNILGIVPSISALGIQPPGIFRKYWYDLEGSSHRAAPFLLGGLTFFLPCGFTQSMQIFALASGSFWTGALGLLLFAFGTTPVLLALGVGVSWGKFKKMGAFQKAAGILILLFAVFTLKSGLALKGVKTNVISSKDNEEQVNKKTSAIPPQNKGSVAGEQTVTMKVTASGFEPSVIKIKQGVPVKWVIDGVNVSGCTSTIIVPSFNISKNLKYGENIVQFMPQKKGEIAFSCGMGMVRGKFMVE
jgi:uncharacterized protein